MSLTMRGVLWILTLIVLAGNPGGIPSAMGTLNNLAQRSRSLPTHSLLSIVLFSKNQDVRARPTFDLKRWPISGCFHDPTQEDRDVGNIASFKHRRCLFQKVESVFHKSRFSSTLPCDVLIPTSNSHWNARRITENCNNRKFKRFVGNFDEERYYRLVLMQLSCFQRKDDLRSRCGMPGMRMDWRRQHKGRALALPCRATGSLPCCRTSMRRKAWR